MDLTLKDRLIIANQCKILEKLYPDEADYYAEQRTAIEHGYKLHYNELVENLYEEMSEDECREVLNILEMYRGLTFSYKELEDKKGINPNQLKFEGFDGNEETKQFSYAQYFIVELNRFQELTYGAPYPDLNSHSPRLATYRRMLKKWLSYETENKYKLNKKQIEELMGA